LLRRRAPAAGSYITSLAPATGEPIAEAPVAEAADVDAAVQAAHAAFASWRCTMPAERGQLLREAANVLRLHADDLRGRSNLLPQ
jgi:betaine-aldehyde dehydrogenase